MGYVKIPARTEVKKKEKSLRVKSNKNDEEKIIL